jgi:hypothetical protein
VESRLEKVQLNFDTPCAKKFVKGQTIASRDRTPFVEYLAGQACLERSDQPPEASVASGASNPHGEAYTASPKAVLLSLEIKFNVGVFVVV